MPPGVLDQFMAAGQAEFVHQFATMRVYGAGADYQLPGDLLAAKPFRQEGEDLLFPRTED